MSNDRGQSGSEPSRYGRWASTWPGVGVERNGSCRLSDSRQSRAHHGRAVRTGAVQDCYGRDRIEGLEPWCVFDNTAASAVTGNAPSLIAKLRQEPR